MNATAASFGGAKVDHCDFTHAVLRGGTFARGELIQCLFRHANLRQCDFTDARLLGGDFGLAVLEGARFGGAVLKMADFRGANLAGARELTSDQLMGSITDGTTVLPNGKRGPYVRNSGAERVK